MTLDIFKIAQKLYDELNLESEQSKLRAEGVALLFDRLKKAVDEANSPPEVMDAEITETPAAEV